MKIKNIKKIRENCERIIDESVKVLDTDSVLGSTNIVTDYGIITIADLFQKSINKETHINNFIGIFEKPIKALSCNNFLKNQFKTIKYIKKHLVTKEMFNIKIKDSEVIVTCDHSVIIYDDKNKKLISKKPSEITSDDILISLNNYSEILLSSVKKVISLGVVHEWVYDIEVEDNHNFYGNSILVHNSNYICLDEIKTKYANDMDFEKFALKMENDFFKPYIKSIFDTFAKEHNCENMLDFKREGIILAQFVLAKKKYITKLIRSEDTIYNIPKIKATGVETVRTSTPKYCRENIMNVISFIFENLDKNKITDLLRIKKKEFDQQLIADIANVSSVQEYTKYAKPTEYYLKHGLSFDLRTPMHIKASMCYNYIVKKFNLPYVEIGNGTKIKYIRVFEQNIVSNDCVAFIGNTFPPELETIFKIDKEKQFEKTFLSVIQRMFDVLNWGTVQLKSNKMSRFLIE